MPSELQHFLIIEGDCIGLQEHILDAPLHSVGRDPKCDIRLTSRFVSRRQATLVKIADEDGSFHYRIVDGVPKGRTSSNGILVNGRKTLACDLQDQDEILFGPHIRATYQLREEEGLVFADDTVIPTSYWT